MDNLISFYNSVKSYLPKPDPNHVKKDFDNDDYLYLPPQQLSSCKKIEKPEKASDFQTNSLCFIKDLIKKIPPNLSNKTGTKNVIRLSDNVKTNINFFISVINELINEMETQQSYNKTFVFVFFLFFLYFINFRLGQIVLYSVFFHLRETSDQLSNIFQKLVENSMTYSVVQLDKIVTDLSNNKIDSIIVLPDQVNGHIKLNKIEFLDYSFMDTFGSVLSDIMNDNNTIKSSSSTATAPPSATTTKITNTQMQDIVKKTEDAKNKFNDEKQTYEDATKAAEDADQTLNHIIKEHTDAIAKANEAKTAATTAAAKYTSAEREKDTKSTTASTARTNSIKLGNIVSSATTTTTPFAQTAALLDFKNAQIIEKNKAKELATAVGNLATVKHEVETAFKNTVKAQLRCQQVAKDLLAAFQNKQTTSSNLINAQKSFETANYAYNSILEMSQDAQKIMIQSKYTTNNAKINSKDIINLKSYLPMTNEIDVKTIINTMNELSLGIAKKYNQSALEKQLPTKPPTTKGGKQKYIINSKSVKASAHLHKNKGRSIQRYRIHF